jgi:hypothetical protein
MTCQEHRETSRTLQCREHARRSGHKQHYHHRKHIRPKVVENTGSRPLSHSQATNRRISSWVGDDQRIPAVVCFLLGAFLVVLDFWLRIGSIIFCSRLRRTRGRYLVSGLRENRDVETETCCHLGDGFRRPYHVELLHDVHCCLQSRSTRPFSIVNPSIQSLLVTLLLFYLSHTIPPWADTFLQAEDLTTAVDTVEDTSVVDGHILLGNDLDHLLSNHATCKG